MLKLTDLLDRMYKNVALQLSRKYMRLSLAQQKNILKNVQKEMDKVLESYYRVKY